MCIKSLCTDFSHFENIFFTFKLLQMNLSKVREAVGGKDFRSIAGSL